MVRPSARRRNGCPGRQGAPVRPLRTAPEQFHRRWLTERAGSPCLGPLRLRTCPTRPRTDGPAPAGRPTQRGGLDKGICPSGGGASGPPAPPTWSTIRHQVCALFVLTDSSSAGLTRPGFNSPAGTARGPSARQSRTGSPCHRADWSTCYAAPQALGRGGRGGVQRPGLSRGSKPGRHAPREGECRARRAGDIGTVTPPPWRGARQGPADPGGRPSRRSNYPSRPRAWVKARTAPMARFAVRSRSSWLASGGAVNRA